MPRQLTNLRIDEVSSVDRGAGKGVRVTLMKRDALYNLESLYKSLEGLPAEVAEYAKRTFSADERQSAADSGEAMSDGSFPIKNKDDLKNAIRLAGNAKDPAKAKAHIKTRARALGASDAIPDTWGKRDPATVDKALALALESIISEGGAQLGTAKLVECFKQFHAFLEGQQENDMTITVDKEGLDKLIADGVAKALAAAGLDVKKMTPEHTAYHQNLDGDEAKKFGSMSHDERDKYMKEHPHDDEDEDLEEEGDNEPDAGAKKVLAKLLGKDTADAILKAAKKKKKEKVDGHDGTGGEGGDGDGGEGHDKDARKMAKALTTENVDLKKRLAVLEERDQVASFKKRAVDLGLPESDGEMLLKAHRGDPKALEEIEKKIKALTAQVEKSGLFDSFGSDGGTAATAHDELVNKAAEIRKKDPKLTVDQAYVQAMTENPDIAKREKAERDRRINKLAA
jgi:hypothetical protein